jgi:hypothetical protein
LDADTDPSSQLAVELSGTATLLVPASAERIMRLLICMYFKLKVVCNEKRAGVSKMAVVSIEYGDIDIFPFLPSTDKSLGTWHVKFQIMFRGFFFLFFAP